MLLSFVLACAMVAPASAGTHPRTKSKTAAKSKKKAKKAKKAHKPKPWPRKARHIDFLEGEKLTGDLVRPQGDGITGFGTATHGSLIRIRTQFIPEIIKSADGL